MLVFALPKRNLKVCKDKHSSLFWVGVRGKEKGFKACEQSQQRLDKMSTKPRFVNQWDDATTRSLTKFNKI